MVGSGLVACGTPNRPAARRNPEKCLEMCVHEKNENAKEASSIHHWLPLFSFIESESIYEMLNVCAPAIRIKGVFSPNPPFLLRYQGELLGLWDPQNRDLRRKPSPETEFLVGFITPLGGGC